MPLFAHWRHAPAEEVAALQRTIASDAGGGHDDEAVLQGDTATAEVLHPSSPIFCAFDATIEARLGALHGQQRVHGNIHHEIDRYLVACLSPGLVHLVLPRNNVPHYDNLPDISAYAIGILDPSMDSDPELQQVLLLLRQCTPLRRRTKRAQREVQWREESLFPMQTLVRCMQVYYSHRRGGSMNRRISSATYRHTS